jgi:thioredoxin-related protein
MKKMMLNMGLLMTVFPFIGFAQEGGIIFEKENNWEAVKAKAKATHKLIFLDCYASWCGPCKAMDKDIYTQEKVGAYYNSKFVCLKLQMDTSKQDDDEVKRRYVDAHYILQHYKINAYPTFLFFSPDGKILHKGIGYKNAEEFTALGANAVDPDKQYYTLLDKYNNGQRDTSAMIYLSNTARALDDEDLAEKIADDYIKHTLLKLSNAGLYTKAHLSFICINTRSSKDPGFSLLYHHLDKVGRSLGDTVFVRNIIDYIIAKEDIDPFLWRSGKPSSDTVDWRMIKSAIDRKYNATFAERTITAAQMRWYSFKGNWPEFSTSTYLFVEKYGANMNDFDLDVHAWAIFQHSMNREELAAAVNWIKRALEKEPTWTNALDTYANLLYKLGDIKDCIPIEQKAITLEKYDSNKKGYQETLDKMQTGKPTWTDN